MSDDERSGLDEEHASLNRASLLKRVAVGGAALSIPSLIAAEGASRGPPERPRRRTRSTRSGSSRSSTT